MSAGYALIKWNRRKRVYDGYIVGAVVLYLAGFVAIAKALYHGDEAISDEILLMRALGSCAFLMLTVILCIGPLARLDRRFLPLLYNRRHLGVATFGIALLHGVLVLGFYHGFGNVNPLRSLLGINTNFASLRAFPFQVLGLATLTILFLMASTSHDFWNKNLGPRVWKSLHMLVYPAYGLIVMHVALGALQTQRGVALAILVSAAAAIVSGLHMITGRRERGRDTVGVTVMASTGGWVHVADVSDLPDGRGRAVCAAGGERIAVFRDGNRVSALANVCAHQGGPLGEGRIIDGCVTCPWHGWQYRPVDGASPPPFKELVATYRGRVQAERVYVDPRPLPPGTHVEPAEIREKTDV